jgi:adenine phosphoribosyltransferase
VDLRTAIRTIPDFPKPGIMFRDITTLLADPGAFRHSIDEMARRLAGQKIDKVAAIEARGFIFGAALAYQICAGLVPVRKRGKLPYKTIAVEYALEYGVDAMEMHHDSCAPPDRVLVVDDLIATGGTAEAAIKLVRQAGGEVVGAVFVVDLPDLGGADRIRAMGVPVTALTAFEGH